MTRLPALGPRGEGWVVLQGVLLVVVAAAGLAAHGNPSPEVIVTCAAGGLALIVAGLGFATAGILALRRGDALTAVPGPLPDSRLVDDGPYRLVRHPIYTGIVVSAIGWAVARTSLPALVAALVLLAFFDLKARREEVWLVAQHPGYEAYRARTRRLVPGVY